MQKYLCPLLVLIAALFYGCEEEPPVFFDGQSRIELLAFWDNTAKSEIEPLSFAKVIVSSEYGINIYETDAFGKLLIENLPAATYNISIRKHHPLDSSIIIYGSLSRIKLLYNSLYCDTIKAITSTASGITINEIYAFGPVNNIFFLFDQYVELYNASDSIQYLDGLMLSRVSKGSVQWGPGAGADYDNDGDIDSVTYIYKFPGRFGEKNYPFSPKKFLVIASDASDHTKTVSTSVNLSNADWETFNQFSAVDIDNPDVPNLTNLRSNVTVDFLMNLSDDIIVLSDGRDSVWSDGIDISSIIDGIEYQAGFANNKTLDPRVDRSFAFSPPRYSGQSIQRKKPGIDTNDGNIDWEITPYPTPGYHMIY